MQPGLHVAKIWYKIINKKTRYTTQHSLIYNTNDLFDGITSYAIRFTRPMRSTYGDFYIGSKRSKSDYLSVSGQFVT